MSLQYYVSFPSVSISDSLWMNAVIIRLGKEGQVSVQYGEQPRGAYQDEH